jgi:N-acetylglucosamine-6-sulfatase
MQRRTITSYRFLLTAAGLSALAAATVYCSSGGSGATSGGDGGAPGADATTANQEGGGSVVGGGDAAASEDAATPQSDAGAGSDGAVGASDKPNILFFLTDDLSWNLVPHMPNVQALQKKGVTFSHYFVTESLCCPSRSSIFTGKYPHDTGVLANSGVMGGYAAFQDGGNENSTFATALSAQGYHLKMMGKYLNGYNPGSMAGVDPSANPKDPGWTDWAVAGDGYPEYHYWLNENGTSVYFGDAGSDYLTTVLHGMAADYAVPANSPFVLEVASFAPHAPYIPAPADVGTYDAGLPSVPSFNVPNVNPPGWLEVHKPLDATEITRLNEAFNLRVEAVQAVDRMIGDLMTKLAANGLDKNTYVIFSSDNGYHMGEHMLEAGKQTAFDTDINVPLIVVGPGVPAGVIDDHVVENIDLCPTFAELGGAQPLATADGHSLVPLIHGQSVTDWRNVLLVEHLGGNMDPADPDNEQNADGGPGSGPDPTTYDAIRMMGTAADGGATEKVFVSYVDGETEYYDIDNDPYEMTNTVGNLAPAAVTQYKGVVSAIKACKGTATCWSAQHM